MSRWIKGFNLGKTSKPLKKLWLDYIQVSFSFFHSGNIF
jgi:hypothetical protein